MTDTNYKFEVGKWYKLRNGWDAQILDDNFKGLSGETLAGKIRDNDGVERTNSWQSDGRWVIDQKRDRDLMPPVEIKEFWGGVYPNGAIFTYQSKSVADEYAGDARIGLLKITITGDDYTVEKVGI